MPPPLECPPGRDAGAFFVILTKENSYLLQCELSVNYRKVTVIMLKYNVGDLYAKIAIIIAGRR